VTNVADKVYLKQPGEPYIPVTARINWLPNGKIKPLLYWTPDGSCYNVEHIYEMTPLAFLRNKGEGIRFKVRADLKETPEPYVDDGRFFRHETYLYFADSMFCGKNIIDERYGHKGKEFIPVTLDIFPNGEYEIVFFEVNGAGYIVDKTVAIEPRASYYAGGAGMWHKVDVRQVSLDECHHKTHGPLRDAARTGALYFEINKWFIIPASR